MTVGPAPGCGCDPAWPSLVVHADVSDVTVEPAATPGGLACLYQAYCAACGATYPGPFRARPGTGQDRPGLPRLAPPPVKGRMLLSRSRTPRPREGPLLGSASSGAR
jgi:hypothetical protein